MDCFVPDSYGLLRLDWSAVDSGLSAGFTTRRSGVSEGPYHSLNMGLHVEDEPSHVIANRRLLATRLDIPFERWVGGEQVHGCNIAVVTEADHGRGSETRTTEIAATDALITNEPGIWLTAVFADCVPLYFFDPRQRAVGLAHAGWKGTALEIAVHTVNAMRDRFGSRPEDLYAAIGPSIGMCCYEVDDTVVRHIPASFAKGSEADLLYLDRGGGKFRLSLQQWNRQIMIKAGILPVRIEVSTLCTGCDTSLFYSYRAENGLTGRMAAWIGLDLTSGKREG